MVSYNLLMITSCIVNSCVVMSKRKSFAGIRQTKKSCKSHVANFFFVEDMQKTYCHQNSQRRSIDKSSSPSQATISWIVMLCTVSRWFSKIRSRQTEALLPPPPPPPLPSNGYYRQIKHTESRHLTRQGPAHPPPPPPNGGALTFGGTALSQRTDRNSRLWPLRSRGQHGPGVIYTSS